MANSMDEKRKSIANSNAEIVEARVVANYGDPGLDENYHFDILSRYVIVMIESAYRIPTINRWNKVLAVVARPKHLWITAEGGRAASPNSQRRSDSMGNISIGLAGSFSTAGIPRINSPYKLGELIKIKKLPIPHIVGRSDLFVSEFSNSEFTYEDWHSEGSTLDYFVGNTTRLDGLKAKTLFRPDADKS